MLENIKTYFELLFSVLKGFKLQDGLDIALMSVIFYFAIRLVRETRAGQLVKGFLVMISIYGLATIFDLKMLALLFGNFLTYSFLAILVILQPEVRRTLEKIGRTNLSQGIIETSESVSDSKKRCINEIVKAAVLLQKTRTGALIVFERKTKLGEIISSGTIIDAKANSVLLRTIFFDKTPLHDGAVIIRNARIYACGCILPLSRNENVGIQFGTRHRAALGMSENSDAVLIIVSEENGIISSAINGVLKRNYTEESLKKELEDTFALKEDFKNIKRNLFNFLGVGKNRQ